MDCQFRLELANASTSRDELGALRRGQAALKSAVDSVLPAPAVHRLVADTQVAGDVLDAASGRHEIQNPLTKLRGVTASSHAVLQCLGGTAAWWIPILRLQEIQGALPGFKSRAPDQKSYSNRGLRLLRLARGGHRVVTDFLGTRWRQPRPSGFRTVNLNSLTLSQSRYFSTRTAPGP